MAEDANTIVLVDEDGTEHGFEILDVIEVQNEEYAILLPIGNNGAPEDEAIILKVAIDEEGEEVFYEIEDDEEWEMVASAWKEILETES
ncbi:MAG: DUF1292 domain-containing protein [Clostridia bacterium]|nr:DUF1292 domain-containing protein [Clostridia bacterium]